jgi:hypothetical protein
MENYIPKIGDTVKIITANAGAFGSQGSTGTVTDKPSTNGTHGGIHVELSSGQVWDVGKDALLMMIKSNDVSQVESKTETEIKTNIVTSYPLSVSNRKNGGCGYIYPWFRCASANGGTD